MKLDVAQNLVYFISPLFETSTVVASPWNLLLLDWNLVSRFRRLVEKTFLAWMFCILKKIGIGVVLKD